MVVVVVVVVNDKERPHWLVIPPSPSLPRSSMNTHYHHPRVWWWSSCINSSFPNFFVHTFNENLAPSTYINLGFEVFACPHLLSLSITPWRRRSSWLHLGNEVSPHMCFLSASSFLLLWNRCSLILVLSTEVLLRLLPFPLRTLGWEVHMYLPSQASSSSPLAMLKYTESYRVKGPESWPSLQFPLISRPDALHAPPTPACSVLCCQPRSPP